MREAAGDEADRVFAVAKLALGLDAEPLRPGDRDEILRKPGARDLLGAFNGQSRRAAGARRLASDDEIVGEPSGIAGLPVDAGYAAEIDAKSVRSAEKIEKKSGGDGALIAETATARRLNRRFLLHDLLAAFVRHDATSGRCESQILSRYYTAKGCCHRHTPAQSQCHGTRRSAGQCVGDTTGVQLDRASCTANILEVTKEKGPNVLEKSFGPSPSATY